MTAIILVAILVSSILLNIIFIFGYLYTRKSKTRNILINLTILTFTILYLGLFLELIFYNFFIQSDGFAITLASGRWFQEYWNPINNFSYRDDNHSDGGEELTLFVVGDSFVAGHGIKDYQDRFSNLLADKLGDEWEVHNIAMGNWSTQDEYRALIEYPFRPDFVIFSYFINDIEGAASQVGNYRPSLINPPPSYISPLINRSYLLNYVYWRLYRIKFAAEMRGGYFRYLQNAFLDPEIQSIHQEELLELIDYARSNDANMLFILFPNLADIDGSSKFTAQVGEFLNREGVIVIDLGVELKGRTSEDLVVSSFDAHPNVLLHQEIAEILYDHFKTLQR